MDGRYPLEKREMVAVTDDLRVSVLTLAAGQERPWHHHTLVTDTFYCLEGPMVVETRAPAGRYELAVGQSVAVPPKVAHRITGRDGGRCRFLLVQGIGGYDYVSDLG